MIHCYAENLQQLFQDTIAQERCGIATVASSTGTAHAFRSDLQRPHEGDDAATSEGGAPSYGRQSASSTRNPSRDPFNGFRSLYNGFAHGGAPVGVGGNMSSTNAQNLVPEVPLPGDMFFMEGLEGYDDQTLGFPGLEYSMLGQQYPTSDFVDRGLGSMNMDYDTFRMG